MRIATFSLITGALLLPFVAGCRHGSVVIEDHPRPVIVEERPRPVYVEPQPVYVEPRGPVVIEHDRDRR